jgi:hypothetical protein
MSAVMKKVLRLVLPMFALLACGGSNPAPADPSVSSTSMPASAPTTPAAAPTAPATPDTAAAPTTSAPPAMPASTPSAPDTSTKPEPCAAPKDVTAKDLASCKNECKKLDDKAPAGSKCIPPRTACLSNCDTKFKK